MTVTDWGWREGEWIRKRDEILAWFSEIYSPKGETLVEEMAADGLWFRSAEVELSVEHLGGDVQWEVGLMDQSLGRGLARHRFGNHQYRAAV